MPTKFSSKQMVTAVVVFLAVVLVIGYIIFSLIVEDQELSEKGVSKDTKPPQTRDSVLDQSRLRGSGRQLPWQHRLRSPIPRAALWPLGSL